MSEEIKKQAKKIIDNFVKELDKVETKGVRVERKEDRRGEKGKKRESDNDDFRKIMLGNAPGTKKGKIKAERGKWEK